MRRREFIGSLIGTAVAWPLAGRGQQPAKVYRIGMLDTASRELNATNLAAFGKGLREFGYVEGENLVIEYRSAEGHNERIPDLVSELLRLGVDLIVVRGTPEVMAVKNATSTIPVVMTAVYDPVRSGVVTNLPHPGGNITGLSSLTDQSYMRHANSETLAQAPPHNHSRGVHPSRCPVFRCGIRITLISCESDASTGTSSSTFVAAAWLRM
jgi:putative ABC transport system substrate-binding protein